MDEVLLRDLGELRHRLTPHLARARKVIAFGSVARGDADASSDLDLIIVADTARTFFERFKDFEGLYDVWPRLDLLIYTRDRRPRLSPTLANSSRWSEQHSLSRAEPVRSCR